MAHRWATIALCVALIASLVAPVYAHTTLGNLNGSAPYFRSNDHELNPTNTFGTAHVPGPLGFVWPGSGLDAYTNNPANPPGYQSPFTDFEKPYQIAGNSYAPEGAILTSTADHDSVGDFIFAVNFSQPYRFTQNNPNINFTYRSLALYVPAPVVDKTGTLIQDGFEPTSGIHWDSGDNTNIITTLTDNYANIFVTRADRNDPFAPNSWLIFITAPNNITFTAAHHWSEWYYIRINQMRAPEVAGRYFFKMFLDNHFPVRSQKGSPNLINSTMPMENWPVLLVKGEVDPAFVWGTVRYGDTSNGTLYGLPLSLPGRIRAVGIAIDSVTGETTGRPVEAWGYFNASSRGHFEVEGVAPGIYDLYASAAGFPEQKVAEKITLYRGQSFRLDAYLKVGPTLKGEIFSKQDFGPIPWPGQRPITIVIYDSNNYTADNIISYSPSNLTHAPYTSYVIGNTLFSGNGLLPPNQPKLVAFPWEGLVGYYTGTPPPDFKDPFGIFNGVGPAQTWWVDPGGSLNPSSLLGSTNDLFIFQFGAESVYGVPTKLSGMVPQIFATWTDSLETGTYYIRVYINGYVQTTNDGTTFVDYPFKVPDLGYARDIFLPIDIIKTCAINVTVHFHEFPGTLVDSPILGPDPRRLLIAEAFARDGTLASLNFTQVDETSREATISLDGLGMAGPLTKPIQLPFDTRLLMKYSLARYRGLYDYGLPTDSYTVRVFMRGYIQALPPADSFEELDQPVSISISVGTCSALLSTHMYRGGGINTTIYSNDWEMPPTPRNWIWNNTAVSTLVYDIASQSFIDVTYFWDAVQNQWLIPTQNSRFSTLPWSGWKTVFGPTSSLLMTNGSVTVDRFGPDLPNVPSLDQSQDMVTFVFLEENFRLGFLYSSTSYRTVNFRSALAIYPGVYAINVWTYGYVQDNVAALGDLGNVHVAISSLGTIADASIRVMIGVNFTIRILFKTEGIFAGIPYNSTIRIRIFDHDDTIVAATSLFADAGNLEPASNAGFFADGKKLLQHPIPAGTISLEYRSLAGLFSYVDPSAGGGSNVRTATLFSPDHGVWGRSTHAGSYTGDWTIMVDIINWYLPTQYYPPVPGLLQGESPYFLPFNHLGPYAQRAYTTIPNAAQGSEASVEFELDRRGYIQGILVGMDWADETRTMSWISIQVESNTTTQYWYSWDGFFDGYLDPGHYNVTFTEWTNHQEGHHTYQTDIVVSPGQMNQAMTIILDESGIPIPEFSIAPLTGTLGALLAFAFLKRRRFRRQ